MSKDLKLNAYSRKAKIDSKKEILAVVYGPKKENKNLTIGRVEFEKMLKLAGFSSLIDLVVDEKETLKVLIKAIQKDPIKSSIIHVDFFAVDMDKKVLTEVELNLIGKSGAVQNFGGLLVKNKSKLKTECLPANLVRYIDVDVSKLATLKDLIRVNDVNTPENVIIKNDPRDVVISVVALKKAKSDQAKVAAETTKGKK